MLPFYLKPVRKNRLNEHFGLDYSQRFSIDYNTKNKYLNQTVGYMDATPLNVEEEQRRSDLVQRLKQGTVSLTEAQELRNLLEREKHMVAQQRNCLALLAVTFLISYVDEYLEAKSNSLLASEA